MDPRGVGVPKESYLRQAVLFMDRICIAIDGVSTHAASATME